MNFYKYFQKYSNFNVAAVIFLSVLSISSFAQITVNTSYSPQQLVQDVLVGQGVSVSNITFTGNFAQRGYFYYPNNALGVGVHIPPNTNPPDTGIKRGIILSTGLATDARGPNNNTNVQTDFNRPGNSDLSAISGGNTYDAAVLEFDFVPQSDTIRFRYVFASEEYPDYVCSDYNDVFAFFLSGPGITGPYSSPAGFPGGSKNIALIPGTNIPVAINSVNSGSPGSYYDPWDCISLSYSSLFINNGNGNYGNPQFSNNQVVQYNGLTRVFTAKHAVIPCQTYHIKLAIADVADGIYDSGVFIEASSFSSIGTQAVVHYTNSTVGDTAVEGCNNAIITFTIPSASISNQTINYTVQGTATNGVDYNGLPGSIVIPAGQTSVNIPLTINTDNLNEGVETLLLIYQTTTGCAGNNTDTLIIYISDKTPLTLNTSSDTSICNPGAALQLAAYPSGGYAPFQYNWSPVSGSASNITVYPTTSNTYYISVSDACGQIAKDSIFVQVGQGYAFAGNDTAICQGSSLTLTANNGLSYLWNTGETTQSITVSPSFTSVYVVTVTNQCIGVDTVKITVNLNPQPNITTPTPTICSGSPVNLYSQNGYAVYNWSSTPADSSLTQQHSSSVTVFPNQTTTYHLEVISQQGCSGQSELTVEVIPMPTVTLTANPLTICAGDTVRLEASGAQNYLWTSNPYDPSSNGQTYQPLMTVTPAVSTHYTVNGSNGSCSATQSVFISVSPQPNAVFVATPEQICERDTVFLQYLGATFQGNNYLWEAENGILLNSSSPEIQPVVFNQSGTWQVCLTVSNSCQPDSQCKVIRVIPSPLVDFVANPTEGCPPLLVEFQNTSTNVLPGAQLYWDFGPGYGIVKDLNYYSLIYNNPGLYNVSLTVVNPNNCRRSKKADSLIFVYPKPRARIVCSPDFATENEPGINFSTPLLSTESPFWYLSDGFTSGDSAFYHEFDTLGLHQIYLLVTNSFGCTDTAKVVIEVKPDFALYIPAAFTPNGDGNNDLFVAKGWRVLDFEMHLFDRWGNQIFESHDINYGWDGKTNGVAAPQGVYTYLIKAHGLIHPEKTYTGIFVLLR